MGKYLPEVFVQTERQRSEVCEEKTYVKEEKTDVRKKCAKMSFQRERFESGF